MNRQNGFTLAEIVIAMAVASLLLVAFMPDYISEINTKRADLAAGEMWQMAEAAQLYAGDNAGMWPDQANNCAGAAAVLTGGGYLPAGTGTVSTWDGATNYITGCPVVGGRRMFQVSLDLGAGNDEWAEQVASQLMNGEATGTVAQATVPQLAALAGLDALLPRDGSRPMTGDLDMGGNNINNAANVNATGDVTAERFIDAADPTKMVDPAGTSNLSIVNVDDVCIAGRGCLSEAVLDEYIAEDGDTVPKPACRVGSPRIYVSTMLFSPGPTGDPIGAVQSWASDAGADWQVHLRVLTPSGWVNPPPGYGYVKVSTKCR